ncbi:Endonuclease/Exonuclease/phosphatase family protein [Nocardioides sp. J9]|uniref:endonuclease/exonuclease/phosphatase family protein n=1 Tax=unclassified Nocardioides TaxID=2615069 RepID=UPI00048B4FD3|nr:MULTISPECIES: endonuclease/exonuclease/phosphatase family protein [unclassified Nocardioides]TWG95128.1 Endonuclease/Exonuclease/phosphatase family protein [Nocardioides sp. J9]
MPDHSAARRRAARSDLVPVVAVVVLSALLLGLAFLWGDEPEAASDPVQARADIARAVDTSRARHDAEDREVSGELIEPLSDEAASVPRTKAKPKKQDERASDLEDLRVAAESQVTKIHEVSFGIATFNVLASKHTDGGARSSWPGSGWRTPQAAAYIRSSGVSVVGLQEVKSGQLSGLTSSLGFQAWPAGSDPDNSVIWDPAVFELVSGDAFYIKFMHGTRMQPIVRLRHKKTNLEFYFLNMHASAGGGPHAASRAAGHNTAVATVNRLKAEGIPIFLTGDMNDREAFFCRVLPPTGMVAAVGGSTAGGCRPPGQMPVDWIVATPDVSFSGFVNDKSTVARRVSDHHYVWATATVQGAS